MTNDKLERIARALKEALEFVEMIELREDRHYLVGGHIAEALEAIAACEAEAGERLFEAIQHGDDEHRAWLKEAITAFFAGEPVPQPRGKGTKERLLAEAGERERGGTYFQAMKAATDEIERLREALADINRPMGNPPHQMDGDDAETVIRWWRDEAIRGRELARAALNITATP